MHHVVHKGSPDFGDDVPENLVMVCGSGSSRCHGALHGAAYVDADGKRWTSAEARRSLGVWLLAHRPDVIAYVLGKFGDEAGRSWLERRYLVELPA